MNAEAIVKELRDMLPPKEDYAELVCSPVPSSYGQFFVWSDPEPHIIANAADLIEHLQFQLSAAERRERAAVDAMNDIEDCLICMPGGAGCNQYGNPTCYRTRRGPIEGEEEK